MNIVITLPEDLIKKIALGQKTVEVRKNYPKDFDPAIDSVYVVKKGTNDVVMRFQMYNFNHAYHVKFAWALYHSQMGIPYEWYRDYTMGHDKIYLWKISSVFCFFVPWQLKTLTNLTNNPQSFAYIRKLD